MKELKPKSKRTAKKPQSAPALTRLNKFIANAGVASRRKADELIESGVVRVNSKVVTELGHKINRSDFVTINGDPVKTVTHYTYILLNKPKDTITTSSDEKNRTTVMDIIRTRARVFPVGRLDRNTTGVLLLTNDGELANRLTHPRYEIPRVYVAGLDKPLKLEDAKKIAEGIELEEGLTAPCEVLIDPTNKTKVILTLSEGKNHEVKRIFETLHYEVKKLDRKSFAILNYKGLNRGAYRHLTKSEVQNLKKFIGMD